MPVAWIKHKGKEILYVDFSGQSNQQAMAQGIVDELRLLGAHPGKSMILVNVTDAVLGNDVMEKVRQLGPEIEKHVAKRAIIGVEGLKSILVSGLDSLHKQMPFKSFSNLESAKDYLVEG